MPTSAPRRAAALLAVSTIAMSTAVLSATGVASAATDVYTFSTDSAAVVDLPGAQTLTMEGDCTVEWDLIGGAGGAGAAAGGPVAGASGGRYSVTTMPADGDVFTLYPGGAGGDGNYVDATTGTPGLGGGNGQAGAVGAGADGRYATGADTYGGGGGASSDVLLDGGTPSPYLSAFGGDGGSAVDPDGIGGGGGVNQDNSGATGGTDGTPAGSGAGVISGTVTCVTADPVLVAAPAVPTAPTELGIWGGDGTLTLHFLPGEYDETNQPDADGWEYSLDGGTWTSFQPLELEEYSAALTGEVTGLQNGTEYSVRVRGTNATGGGAPSAAETGTPARPVGAPTDVAVTTGAGSVKISWGAPTVAGTFPVGGYEVYISALDSESGGGNACSTTAEVRTCLIGVESGLSYELVVVPFDTQDNAGEASEFVPSGRVPFPATPASVPTASGPLTTSDADGAVKVGEQIRLTGTGYLPNSTVELIMYSTPTVLRTIVADADGNFDTTVTVPAGLANGTHHLVAAGVDVNGNPRYLVVEVTVSGGVATVATTSGGLAYTGFSALPFVGAGVLALALGGGLLVASRRRQA